MASSDLSLPLDFLDAIARETAAPGGGSVSAVTGAMAAGLVEMAARFSHEWDEAAATIEKARVLRERFVELAAADADAFAAFLAAEQAEKAAALARATRIPKEIAEHAEVVGKLADLVAARGNQRLLGDAYAARRLALAVQETAVKLVKLNLAEAGNLESEPT